MSDGGHVAEQRVKKMRLFIALKPPTLWESALGELQQELKGTLRSKAFRWTRPEQLHITLRFFGSVPVEESAVIASRMEVAVAAHGPFKLRCKGLGCFPNARRARVLWTGISGDETSLQALYATVTDATALFGEPPENRPFKPHLTLARVQQADRASSDLLEHAVGRGFEIEGDWTVDAVILMQSHLSQEGARYETVAEGPLRA